MSLFKTPKESATPTPEVTGDNAAAGNEPGKCGCVCAGGTCNIDTCPCACHCVASCGGKVSCMSKSWKGGCSYLTALMFGLGIAAGPGAIGYFVAKVIGKNMQARTVTVRGMAERDVKADLGQWTVSFEFSDKDLSKTQSTIRQHQQTVINFFKAHGFKEDEIEPGISSIEMRRNGNDNQDVYYVAGSSVSIRSVNIDNISKAYAQAGQLIETGILFIKEYGRSGPVFTVTKFPEFRLEMVEEAMQSAVQTAEKILNGHGKIKTVRHIQQGSFSIADRDANTANESSYGSSSLHKKIRVVHTVTFEVD